MLISRRSLPGGRGPEEAEVWEPYNQRLVGIPHNLKPYYCLK